MNDSVLGRIHSEQIAAKWLRGSPSIRLTHESAVAARGARVLDDLASRFLDRRPHNSGFNPGATSSNCMVRVTLQGRAW